jgi:hypothetical protein
MLVMFLVPVFHQVAPAQETMASPEALTRKEMIIPKDPLLAAVFSVQAPGLGHFYCRKWLRGLAFLGAEVVCVGVAAGIIIEEEVTMKDYDANGDGLISYNEYENWQEGTLVEDQWDKLSNGKKGAALGFAAAGIALHVWNVIDAYKTARKHNDNFFQQLQASEKNYRLGLGFVDSNPGLVLRVKY